MQTFLRALSHIPFSLRLCSSKGFIAFSDTKRVKINESVTRKAPQSLNNHDYSDNFLSIRSLWPMMGIELFSRVKTFFCSKKCA